MPHFRSIAASRTAVWPGSRADLALLGSLALLFFVTILRVVPAEDSVILFDYARSLAQRGVISFGAAETPIEGATDFLWMLLLALGRAAGIDEFHAATLLNLAALFIVLKLSTRGQRALLAFAALSFMTPYLWASVLGFSALFFSCAYVLCLRLRNAADPSSFFLALLLLCLVRPDGVVWAAGVWLARIVEARGATFRADLGRAATHLVLPGLAYLAWRLWYFEEWLPLPFLVKSAGERDTGIFFHYSLYQAARAFLPALLAIPFCAAGRRGFAARRVSCLFVLPFLFYSSMRLEQNIGDRFFAPAFFGAAYLWFREERPRAQLVFAIAAVVLGLQLTTRTMSAALDSGNETVFPLSRGLASFSGKMLTSEAGRLPYYSGWRTHDSWGLNTPQYAHHMIAGADLARERYDLIVMHCKLAELQRPAGAPTAARTWDNHCSAVLEYLRGSDYEIILVPYYRATPLSTRLKHALFRPGAPAPRCLRHDIYAIAHRTPQRAELRRHLLAHDGFAPTLDTRLGDTDLVCR